MNEVEYSRTAVSRYRHSGRVPVSGLVIAFAVLVPAAVVIGILYSGAVVYLPFLKLRCLLTLAYGGLLGTLVGWTCRWTKFRSHFFVAGMVILTTMVSFYVAWAVHCAWYISSADGFSDDVVNAAIVGFDPRSIYGWGQYIFENGLWFKNGKPHDGWEAVAGWIIEAAIVFVTAFWARKSYGNAPFCEDCEQWTVETNEMAALPVSSTDPAWQMVGTGDVAAFRRLKFSESSTDFVELQLASCPSCSSSDYLSAVAVKLKLNKDGELVKKESDLFRSMPISSDQKAEVIEFCDQMAEAQRIMNEAADDEIADLESDQTASIDTVPDDREFPPSQSQR
ncbi:hypothetical protein K227x_37530 [Rubripirellula lacrimiformis]|uniref:Transmembrane protein n=2 Tax=Rubripirellula lacrimiformis TaxID=1930273 RepID=A0A517NDZ5_9BACT|nr:hypothetical protein K227x_37530 [Rubripirellula lacrimiformis]